ncbi:MAG: pyruvate, water dikinase regulatory protein [Pseudomonadota bacterium]
MDTTQPPVKSTKRTAFFISDGTGITAEAVGHSLLAQFDRIYFERFTLPYIDSVEKARQAVLRINACNFQDGNPPIIFDTIVNQEIRAEISKCTGFMVDIFGTFLSPLEDELHTKSSYTVGKSHSIVNDDSYKVRIDAVHYALDNDDGARTRHYDQADVILVGVSRCGKTPTCLYLAMQFGIRAANYPLTEDDLDDLRIPKVLQPHKAKLHGLSIDVDRLTAIRNERKPNSKYASHRQCELEIRGAEALFAKSNIPFINSTHYSVEEISTRLIENAQLKRRVHA